MLLTVGEIEVLNVYNTEYEIITNARFWINQSIKLNNAKDNQSQAFLLLDCVKDKNAIIPEHVARLLTKINSFYACEYETINSYKPTKKQNNKLYDFDIDGGRIFSAFYKTYGVDIESMLDTLHWWKFIAMFNDLSSESNFKGYYMHYRGYDKSLHEYSKAKAEHKTKINEQIKLCSFETEKREVKVMIADTPMQRKRMEAKRLKNG